MSASSALYLASALCSNKYFIGFYFFHFSFHQKLLMPLFLSKNGTEELRESIFSPRSWISDINSSRVESVIDAVDISMMQLMHHL